MEILIFGVILLFTCDFGKAVSIAVYWHQVINIEEPKLLYNLLLIL